MVNCSLPDTLVSGMIYGGLKARYTGPALEIVTARGHRLCVTPNHPILTAQGWVPANALRQGRQLVSDCREVHGSRATSRAHKYDNEAMIHEIYEALGVHPRAMKAIPMDFHGDAQFVEDDIWAMLPLGRLLRDGEAPPTEKAREFGFIPAAACDVQRTNGGEAHDAISLGYESPFRPLRFGLIARGQPATPQSDDDGATGGAESFGELVHAGTGIEGVRDGGRVKLALKSAAALAGGRTQFAEETARVPSGFARKIIEAHAGIVALDEVVEVREFKFSGHVYDLQSDTGWIMAQGIISKQCRCTLLAGAIAGTRGRPRWNGFWAEKLPAALRERKTGSIAELLGGRDE